MYSTFIITNKCHNIKSFTDKVDGFIQVNVKKGCPTLLRKYCQNFLSCDQENYLWFGEKAVLFLLLLCFFTRPRIKAQSDDSIQRCFGKLPVPSSIHGVRNGLPTTACGLQKQAHDPSTVNDYGSLLSSRLVRGRHVIQVKPINRTTWLCQNQKEQRTSFLGDY